MSHKFNARIAAVALSLLLAVSAALADELPPEDALPLSQILRSVENLNVAVIREVEFDDSRWEVTTCKANECYKLQLSPASGKELDRKTSDLSDELPSPTAMKLSEVIKALERREVGVINEIEFHNGYWEVELQEPGRKVKRILDPKTGEDRP